MKPALPMPPLMVITNRHMTADLLATVEDAQLEGKIETKEEAAQFVRSKFKPKSPARSEEETGSADSQNSGLGVGRS